MAAIAAIGLLTAKFTAPYALMGVSYASILLLLTYIFGVRLVYLDQQMAMQGEPGAPPQEIPVPAGMTLTRATIGFGICTLVIFLTGPLLAASADKLAELSGLGRTFVGTTLVAFCTSLPEVVAMIAALRMGSVDLAIGNVFGSNAFNMILLFPLDLASREPLLASVSPRHAVTCVAAILATNVVVLGQLYNMESRKRIIDPDATLVILIVAAPSPSSIICPANHCPGPAASGKWEKHFAPFILPTAHLRLLTRCHENHLRPLRRAIHDHGRATRREGSLSALPGRDHVAQAGRASASRAGRAAGPEQLAGEFVLGAELRS